MQQIKTENFKELTKEELKGIFGGGTQRVFRYCHEAQEWRWVKV